MIDTYNEIYRAGGNNSEYFKDYWDSVYFKLWTIAQQYVSGRIIEIGCGAGQFARMLFDGGITDYTGIDYSKEAIKLARKNNPCNEESFICGDIFDLDILESNYDTVVCLQTLEHIDNDIELIEKIRSGVKVVLSVPNFNSPTHVRFFDTKEEVASRYKLAYSKIEEISISEINKIYLLTGIK